MTAKKPRKTPAKAKGPKKPQPEKANITSFKPGPDPRRTGRPLGSDEYRPEYDDLVIECGKAGMTRTQIACEIGVLRETVTEWAKKHPTFSAAYTKAMMYSQSFWEAMGQTGCGKGHGFNGQTYQFLMKNIFKDDYRDKQEVEHTGDAFKEYMALVRKRDTTGLPPNPYKKDEPKP